MQSICRRHIHKQEKPQPKITEVFLLMTHGMMHKLDIHIYHISDQSELITTEEWIEWPRDIVHKEDRLKCTQVSILGRTGVWQEREKLVFFFNFTVITRQLNTDTSGCRKMFTHTSKCAVKTEKYGKWVMTVPEASYK